MPQGACAVPELGLWGSRSPGSHPHWLRSEEEGILGGFLNPTRSPLPTTLSPRTPPPPEPLPQESSLGLPLPDQGASPALSS